MREILFVFYLLLFVLYVSIDFLLAISLLPSILVSYWLLKDDLDLESVYKEVEKLQEQIKNLKERER